MEAPALKRSRSLLAIAVAALAPLLSSGCSTNDADPPAEAASQRDNGGITLQSYVGQAGMSDLFEIESGKLALTAAQDEGVRNFGQMMVNEHTRSSEMIEQSITAGSLPVSLPTTLDAAHQAKLEKLKAASGNKFDALYMDLQVTAHEEALALHEAYATNGESEALRAIATQIAPVIERHLGDARQIKD